MPLIDFYDEQYKYEICVDEVGRGCMFGDAVVACVILPKPCTFARGNIKDSKKFSSKNKLFEEAENIKQNALYYHTFSVPPETIDDINILQAVMLGMHQCIDCAIDFILSIDPHVNCKDIIAVIDGNYFRPMKFKNESLPFVTIKQGDGKYVGIAAASIIAKTTRDTNIYTLCKNAPFLNYRYDLAKNVGYGTKSHIDGIHKYGITSAHRRSFGICKTANVTENINKNMYSEEYFSG